VRHDRTQRLQHDELQVRVRVRVKVRVKVSLLLAPTRRAGDARQLGLVRLRPSCPNPNPNPNLNPSPNPSPSPNPNLNPNQARLATPAKLRVAELRDALAAAGLARAGKKAELVGRL
jgi:hypothetical protein